MTDVARLRFLGVLLRLLDEERGLDDRCGRLSDLFRGGLRRVEIGRLSGRSE